MCNGEAHQRSNHNNIGNLDVAKKHIAGVRAGMRDNWAESIGLLKL